MCEAAASEKKKIMPSNKVQLLQDPFLNMLRKEHIPVSIYLVNGIKLQGQIESFDPVSYTHLTLPTNSLV